MQGGKLSSISRTALMMLALVLIAGSVVFFTLLNPQVGLLSYLFGKEGGNGILADPHWALPAVALVTVWANVGFTFILMSAARRQIAASSSSPAPARSGARRSRRALRKHVGAPYGGRPVDHRRAREPRSGVRGHQA